MNKILKLLNIIYRILIPQNKRLVINACIFQYGPFIKHYNLGDDLNKFLIEALTNKKVTTYHNCYRKKTENYLCIGSTIEFLSDEHTTIWGSGAIYGTTDLRIKPKQVLAVRGPLTRNYLLSQGIECPEIYGDPALLLPLLYTPKVKKKYKLGIIPHFVDINNNYIIDLRKRDKEVKIIKIQSYKNWKTFIKEINECEFIISSSLHGIIISDAYSIPNKWVEFSDKIIGNGFKFRDYYASINRNINKPLIINSPININDIMSYKNEWIPIEYDYRILLNSCPFNININP